MKLKFFFFKIIKDYVNIAFKGYQNLINRIINIFDDKINEQKKKSLNQFFELDLKLKKKIFLLQILNL